MPGIADLTNKNGNLRISIWPPNQRQKGWMDVTIMLKTWYLHLCTRRFSRNCETILDVKYGEWYMILEMGQHGFPQFQRSFQNVFQRQNLMTRIITIRQQICNLGYPPVWVNSKWAMPFWFASSQYCMLVGSKRVPGSWLTRIPIYQSSIALLVLKNITKRMTII